MISIFFCDEKTNSVKQNHFDQSQYQEIQFKRV